MDPLISIITPAHNAARWLPETLGSVARQTYPHWELAVTDDGSSDDTFAVATAFQKAHPDKNIQVLRHEHAGGPSGARNTSIKATTGEYLAFLDSDDLWLGEHLARAVKVLRDTGADFVFCPHLRFETDPTVTDGPYGRDDARWGPFPDCLYVHCYIIPATVVVRRSAVARAGLFDEDRRVQSGEDLELWMRLAASGARFEIQPVPTTLYRAHPDAASKNKSRMAETKAWAIWKNRDAIKSVPPAFRHQRTGIVCEEAARASRGTRPDKAAGYYLMAFRVNPRRLKYLFYAVACAAYAAVRGQFPPVITRPSP
ncbi:MAG: glycosyltransferase family 2 protein [Terrimicrobiaceae bacterium]